MQTFSNSTGSSPVYVSKSKVSFRMFRSQMVIGISGALVLSLISFGFFPSTINTYISIVIWIFTLAILTIAYLLRNVFGSIKATIYKERICIYNYLSFLLKPADNELLIQPGRHTLNASLVLTPDNIQSFRKIDDPTEINALKGINPYRFAVGPLILTGNSQSLMKRKLK
ncbi:MAG: hypothetical protein Q7R62_00260 [bacterium]|nr:hypothetical protein [bacterium]